MLFFLCYSSYDKKNLKLFLINIYCFKIKLSNIYMIDKRNIPIIKKTHI